MTTPPEPELTLRVGSTLKVELGGKLITVRVREIVMRMPSGEFVTTTPVTGRVTLTLHSEGDGEAS